MSLHALPRLETARPHRAPRARTASVWREPIRQAFAVVALLVTVQAVYLLVLGQGTEDTSSLAVQFPLLAVYLVVAVLLALQPRRTVDAIARTSPAVLALLALALVSYAWSSNQGATFRRGYVLLGTFAVGWWFASTFDRRKQVQLVAIATVVAGFLSILTVLLVPSLGLEADLRGTAWQGVFTTKNTLGRFAAFGVIVSLLAVTTTKALLSRLFFGAGAVMLVVVVVRSQAKIALVAVPACLGVLALVRVIRSRSSSAPALVMLLGAGLIVVALLFVLNYDAILAELGRDAQLTSRATLWSSTWRAAQDHLWLGYGYGGFWNGWNQPSTIVAFENPWGPPHAHNGVLEMLLNLGVTGVALFVAALVDVTRRALRLPRTRPVVDAMWPVTLVVFMVLFNVTEVTLLTTFFFAAMLVAVSVDEPRPAVAAVAAVAPMPATRGRGRRPSALQPAGARP